MRCVVVLGVLVSLACSSGGSGPATPGGGSGGGSSLTGGNGGQGESAETQPPDAGRPAAGQKRVFVTNAAYIGDLRTAAGTPDGLAAGDRLCNTSAQAAALGGTWVAWLSASGLGGSTNAADRIADVGPWYRLDGHKVFNNKANLMTAPLLPIDVDENGRQIVIPVDVWTGTGVGGRSSAHDCNAWNGGPIVGNGTAGVSNGTDERWTDALLGNCSEKRHLYCVEK
jgi:hypothetical protein